ASPKSGNQVTVQWNDSNSGSLATSGSWTDHVTIVNNSTGVTLASGNAAYNAATRGNIQPGGSAAQSFVFTLPNGDAGAGSFQVSITTNANNDLTEFNTAGTATTNNTSTFTLSPTLANYPDLQVASLALSPSGPQSGGQVTVTWNDQNSGLGDDTQSLDRKSVV